MQLKLFLACALTAALGLPALAVPEKTYKGIYRLGSEEETFSPCGTGNKEWWVLTSKKNWNALRDTALRLNASVDEGIFLEVRGFYDGTATEEKSGAFSIQYDGVFRITRIISARSRTAQDCK